MDEPVQFSIDGNEPAPAERHTDTDAAAETEKTRHVLAEKAAVQNELLQARREHAAVSLDRINTEAERAAQDYQQAWNSGDAAAMAASQRQIAALEIRRQNTEAVAERLDRTQPTPVDPIEAFAAGRAPQTQKWIRDHPEFVLNGRKSAKLQAAHSDAIAEGAVPDTEGYFRHVNRFLGIEGGGAESRRSSNDGEIRRVIVTDDPNKTLGRGEVRMTRGEHRAATDGSLTWNYGPKKGQPLGVAEYLKRKGIMTQQGGFYDKLD